MAQQPNYHCILFFLVSMPFEQDIAKKLSMLVAEAQSAQQLNKLVGSAAGGHGQQGGGGDEVAAYTKVGGRQGNECRGRMDAGSSCIGMVLCV
jgi:hypothetical protein